MDATAALRDLPPISPPLQRALAGPLDRETARVVAEAELLLDEHRYPETIEVLGAVVVPVASAPELALRVLFAESWARMQLGQLDFALVTLERARMLAEAPGFTDLDRAETMFRLGACRLMLGKVSNAISLFTVAQGLAQGAGLDGDRVQARVFEWRARCYVRQRDWEAAQTDAERALELAESIDDARLMSLAELQCSVIAERRGDPRMALFYAERAHERAVAIGDKRVEARLLNNMGGLRLLLGEPEIAVRSMKDSFALFLETGNDTDAAQVVSSLAQVHLRCGAPILAEEQARHALTILDGRADYAEERGNASLVLGRALLAQERTDEAMTQFAAAEWLFEGVGAASYLAATWSAQGDAYFEAGDLEAAANLFRRAVEALQDFHF